MIATRCETSDRDLVEAVRAGDDFAFEELYRRYRDRIAAYVRRMVRDPARAEDLTQDAFFAALRRMRTTDAEINFKPWIFEIARNAAIDHWRRSSRAEEVSVDAAEQLSPSDRGRLVGSAGPDSVLAEKERLDHLRGAFDELSDVHTRVLVMRELEGLSYREIAEKLDLSRASVESALFRARRRLETEYADISEGRRCAAMRTVIARLAEGLHDKRDEGRLARHARRCHVCRRRARELGVEPLAPLSGLRRKAAALLPLPLFTRRGGGAAQGGAASSGGHGAGGLSGLLPAGAHVGAAVTERAAAIVMAAALAGAGGMALGGGEVPGGGGDRDAGRQPAIEQRAPGSGAEKRGKGAAAPDRLDPHGAGGAHARDGSGVAGPGGGAGDPAARERENGPDPSPGANGGGGGAGDVGLPQVPAVPPEVQGGAPRGPSGDGLGLPTTPDPPTVEPPSAPDVPLATPRVEPQQPVPLEGPAAPDVPPAANGVGLDSVGDAAAG
jgi:RNA polymerase sigma factor (sigma-70 family)